MVVVVAVAVYSNPSVYDVLLTQDTHSTLVFQF
jgi:hypothetical protein